MVEHCVALVLEGASKAETKLFSQVACQAVSFHGSGGGGWLFPGQNPVNPLTTRQLSRVFHAAKAAAEIDKRVSLHTLRHCFATHLLEQKVDIRVIQVLLGHKKLDTTAHYSQVANTTLRAVKSPLEQLPAKERKKKAS